MQLSAYAALLTIGSYLLVAVITLFWKDKHK